MLILSLLCITLKNSQTYFKNFAVEYRKIFKLYYAIFLHYPRKAYKALVEDFICGLQFSEIRKEKVYVAISLSENVRCYAPICNTYPNLCPNL